MHALAVVLPLLLSGAPVGVHDFTVKANDGVDVELDRYRGKALLIVNTASECGYTPQYQGLDPPWRHLTSQPEHGGEVTWNLDEFLVDPSGRVVAHLESAVEPGSAELKQRIEAILPRR